MILSEHQEQILKTLTKEKQYDSASKLAKEMLVVKHFNLNIENFEENYNYKWCMNSDYEWLKVVKHYIKASIEVFQLDENNEPDGWTEFETFGFLGKDNKLYDHWFCEIPLKEFKEKYGITKKQLLETYRNDDFIITKTDEAIEFADDLEIYFEHTELGVY